MRVAIGLLLLVHGLIHLAIYAPSLSGAPAAPGQEAFKPGHSWVLGSLGLSGTCLKAFGTPLWIVAGVGFALAGLAVFHVLPAAWWQGLAVTAAVASLLLVVLFWHPWLVAAVAADGAVLVGLLVVTLPSLEQLGA